MGRLQLERKAAEIRQWLGLSRFFWCLHCEHVHQVEEIRGGAGSLTCPLEWCDGNPLDWQACEGPKRYVAFPGPAESFQSSR